MIEENIKNKWVIMNEEDGVPLWNIAPFSEAFRYYFPKYTKLPAYSNIFEISNYHFRGFFLKQESLNNSQLILNKVLKNPKYLSWVKKEVLKTSRQFYDFGRKALASDVKKFSDKELAALFKEFERIAIKNISFGMVSTLIDIPHGIFTKKVEDFLSQRIKKLGLKKNAAEYFGILSSIKQVSKGQEEYLGLLNLLLAKKRSKDFNDKIQDHSKEFCWVYYSYTGPAFTEKRVIKEVKRLKEQGINPDKELRNFYRQQKEIVPNIKKAEKELQLSVSERRLFQALRDTMQMKIVRKDALVFAGYVLEGALREVARRARISLEDVRFATLREMERILGKDKRIIDELPKRRNYLAYIAIGKKPELLIGEKARAFVKQVYKDEKLSGINELQGQVACLGKAQGRVRIINVLADMKKMKNGDILVSIATTPDIVPAMKKAAAIVTEQGGITSHAAIVSRELKIPCVIGTKIATKIFKDGDLVEVDANRGIVRKI